MMAELTTTSIRSEGRRVTVTEQPNRFSRWWMRHYIHIGLASMAGSAILICIIAVILLPIAVHKPQEEEEPCLLPDPPLDNPTTSTTQSPSQSNTTVVRNRLVMNAQKDTVIFDPLCAANATWKSDAITVAGSSNGTYSLSPANLRNPNDLFIDNDGNLFIADSDNNRVAYWPTGATEGRIVAGTGALGSWINLLKYATAIIAWKDQLYVSDLGNYRILAFPFSTTEGAPDGTTVVGRYGAGSGLNQINSIYSMSLDRVRKLFYLSDSGNNRILKLNLTDNTLQLVAGTGIADSGNENFNHPLGLTADERTGALYVADSRNNRVQKFNLDSIQGMTVAGEISYGQNLSQLYLPSGVTIDPAGNVYVADSGNHRIVQWLVGSRQGRIIAGTGISGLSNTQLNNPVQLKFDHHHNLYVVDKSNHRIQRFDLLSNGC